MDSKVCSRCARALPLEAFHRRRHYVRNGLRAACKECTAQDNSRRRAGGAELDRDERIKIAVRARTRRAIARGQLVRQPCRVCADAEVQPHHPDYFVKDAHLRVEWLCVEHHSSSHGVRNWTRQLALAL